MANQQTRKSETEKQSQSSNPDKKISILIADDAKIIRQSLISILDLEEDFQVVAQAEDGESAVDLANQLNPDIILMDVSMPGGIDGIEATSQIVENNPSAKVVALSLYDDGEMNDKMLSAGAAAFVSKTNACDDLAPTIRNTLHK